jgi:nucleotide-binding universal stress UspA family protein
MSPAFKTAIVPFGRQLATDAELAVIGAAAQNLCAKLIGVMACEHPAALYYEAGVLSFDPIEEDRKLIRRRIAEQESRFRSALGTARCQIEWRSSMEWQTDCIVREARAADVILVPARSEAAELEPGRLVLTAGRPVLFMHSRGIEIPSDVLIGWKDSREARRAVLDSLPLLSIAKRVHVVEILEGENANGDATKRLDDVVAWLVTHGISATSAHANCERSVGDDLVEATYDSGANLIVAGAYGHSRLGEWIFGGVTRSLLMQDRCSVFLSH